MCRTLLGILVVGSLMTSSCTAMNAQSVARQQAQTYYGRPYEQLSAQEKMRLEDHLSRQDTATWNTGAHVASGLGRLLQGVGVLVLSVK